MWLLQKHFKNTEVTQNKLPPAGEPTSYSASAIAKLPVSSKLEIKRHCHFNSVLNSIFNDVVDKFLRLGCTLPQGDAKQN